MRADDLKRLRPGFFEDVWNNGDETAIAAYIAPAYTIHHDPGDPWCGKTLDRAGFAERLRASRAPFPDQRFEIADLIAADDRVAVAWRWRGTHKGDMPGFPASGRIIETSGVTFYYAANGLLTGHWQAVDRLGVMQQLSGVR